MSVIKSIVFSQRDVAATMDGRKTAKRVIIKQQPMFRSGETGTPVMNDDGTWSFKLNEYGNIYDHCLSCKYSPGDILGVRETWVEGRVATMEDEDGNCTREIRADGDDLYCIPKEWADRELISTGSLKTRLGTQMRTDDIRIFLRVKSVQLARLNDMTEEDAMKEGYEDLGVDEDSPLERYSVDYNNNLRSHEFPDLGWYRNPWVFVLDFERIPYHEAMAEDEVGRMRYIDMCNYLAEHNAICVGCAKRDRCADMVKHYAAGAAVNCKPSAVSRHIDPVKAAQACFKLKAEEWRARTEPWVITMRKKKNYIVTDPKTNNIIAAGDCHECAEAMGISVKAFYKAAMRSSTCGCRKYTVEEKSPEQVSAVKDGDTTIKPLEFEKKVDTSLVAAAKRWDEFVTPIREYYGIPQYVHKYGNRA